MYQSNYKKSYNKKSYTNHKSKNFNSNKKIFYKEEDLEDDFPKNKKNSKEKNKEPLSQIDCYLIEKDKHRKNREYKLKDKEKRYKNYD